MKGRIGRVLVRCLALLCAISCLLISPFAAQAAVTPPQLPPNATPSQIEEAYDAYLSELKQQFNRELANPYLTKQQVQELTQQTIQQYNEGLQQGRELLERADHSQPYPAPSRPPAQPQTPPKEPPTPPAQKSQSSQPRNEERKSNNTSQQADKSHKTTFLWFSGWENTPSQRIALIFSVSGIAAAIVILIIAGYVVKRARNKMRRKKGFHRK